MKILRLKYLKPEGAKQKNKTKARGELFAGSFRKFDSRKTHANHVTNFAHARQKIERLSVHRRKTSDSGGVRHDPQYVMGKNVVKMWRRSFPA